jgi:hypothetical protein
MLTLRRLSLACALLFGLLLIPAVCWADISWTGFYTNSGQTINCTVSVNGANGSYTATDQFGNQLGTGSLFNIQYNPPGFPLHTVRGQWAGFGSTGTFVWHVSTDFTSFNGNWSDGSGNSGIWNGQFQSGSGQLGSGGPFVAPHHP